ncbi:uncharacterized protein K452DRAFT_356283 [Aplosporella prunicola CBS 121167]|uniref:Non-structural maintenance of chromosomes element 1 homolog n=1 Tax=Aplosporella prunicola CBS 121167 TaxID=1176127 RepID=A0A6A6BQR7_9PEZI|nr:uncharacterized protein K452DRAFT_356283 [Aplosporella prunicola CBS 121167]KAF2144931.1 hypothetical protein K452DRAFT_356283 [Aplosporella prunicola CBS 121167]
MADNDGDDYNSTHRAFLQAFLARSVMTFEEAQPILAAILTAKDDGERPILPNDITEADFNTYVATINTALSPLDLEIRSARSQSAERTRLWALVNTTSDGLTQLATTHTADEIAFVKRLLDAMFEAHNTPRAEVVALTSIQALNLHKAPRNAEGSETQGSAGATLTMAAAQKLLNDMVEEGWMEKSRRGFLSLSPRALMELRGWLVETYNEPVDAEEDGPEEVAARTRVKMCEACREIVTVGQRCPSRACLCRLHDVCVQHFFRTHPDRRCPLCKTEWSGDHFVGERAAKPTNRNRGSAGTVASSSRRSTMASQLALSDDDDDDDDDDEE